MRRYKADVTLENHRGETPIAIAHKLEMDDLAAAMEQYER